MKQEIVINNCYGGFSLSPFAIQKYLQLKGKKAYFYKQTEYEHRDGESKYVKIKPTQKDLFYHAVLKDLGKETNKLDDVDYFSDREIKRNDKNLIKIVKELRTKANGSCAKLKIVKIPKDVKWLIKEYDGNEWIAEEHRTWE